MSIVLTYLKLLSRDDCMIPREMNENFGSQKLVKAFARNMEMT